MLSKNRLREQRASTESAWQQYQEQEVCESLRPEVAQSWERSKVAVDLDITAAPGSDSDISHEWQQNPLSVPVSQLEESLSNMAEEGGFIVAVTDAESRILWTTGSSHMRNKAARANFAPGGVWSESAVGTNALDLALRTQKDQTVFSAEHFAPLVHGWVCYAAPIFDRSSNACLGVIDISTTWDNANPLALMAASSFADLISAEASKSMTASQELRISVLGTPSVTRGQGLVNLPRRQLEILFILSLYPRGLSLEELHAAVYGDRDVSLGTLKSELSHMRQALGDLIESRPYRVSGKVRSDFADCIREVKAGQFDRAMNFFGGELFTASTSPVIEEKRNVLMAALHRAALASASVDALMTYIESVPYDLAVCEHLNSIIRHTDPRYAICQAQLDQARAF